MIIGKKIGDYCCEYIWNWVARNGGDSGTGSINFRPQKIT
ncbi:hypothetical protein PL9214650341 [Planktothrix tepida PCC 9214]|uniref:Uncharacterized protein n=1 Tax=Planktothrix tepida PCC 9214 TaxID=671072 RepID=A0A1J1LRR9_9CYAN|nr:hypothetical protein PL9214650341 [Planktothrix tepida PCC 9214]